MCFSSALMTIYHKLNTSTHLRDFLVCVVVCVVGGFSCAVLCGGVFFVVVCCGGVWFCFLNVGIKRWNSRSLSCHREAIIQR